MKFTTATDQLKYFLDKGIVVDIYLARQSHSLLMSLGPRGPRLEGKGYTRFFMQMQSILADHFIIHVTKLFERPHHQYQNISIPAVLKFLEQNQDTLQIIEKELVRQNLAALGVHVDPWKLPSREITNVIVSHFRSTLPTVDDSVSLNALRILRDKRIAHREAIDLSSQPTTSYSEAISLVTYAEDFCCVIGPAYVSTVYGFAGDYFFLTDDARMTANSFEQLVDVVLSSP